MDGPSPELPAAIEALPWVQDGIEPRRESNVTFAHPSKTSLEHRVVPQLMRLYLNSPEALLALVGKPWIRDGVDIREASALGYLTPIANTDPDAALRIITMPFLESFQEADLTSLSTLALSSAVSLNNLLSDPALRGGITDDHTGTVELLYLKSQNRDAAETIGSLPWVQDGISGSEGVPLRALRGLARSRPVFEAVAQRAWLLDELSSDEVTVIRGLTSIDGPTALRILDMPFLETIDGVDAAAMTALDMLAWQFDLDYLQPVLDHPTLRDGITDDQAVVVAAMQIVQRDRPNLVQTLLDPEQVTVEKRVLQLPHSGEVTLSVIHVGPGAHRTMDRLEHAVRTQEDFMAVSFPRSYVGLLVADATSAGGGGGQRGLLTIDPGLEEDPYVISHELAHMFWSFFPSWISEGGAEFMTTVSTDRQFSSNECGLTDNLSDLDRLYGEYAERGLSLRILYESGCYYTLGRGLFLDLYETLGDEEFRRGFRRLYLTLRDREHHDVCLGLELGGCYVRSAFVTHAQPQSATLAEPVISRRYYGPSLGATGAARAIELPGDRLLIERRDQPNDSFELAIGRISADGTNVVLAGVIRDETLGATYVVVRRESDGRIVRRWVPPYSPLVYQIPWQTVNTQYTVPVAVVAAIPLDDQLPESNMLVRRFDGGDDRIFAYDAGLRQWRHVPDLATFQALGFYWCNVTAADAGFFERLSPGPPYPATDIPARGDYPNCLTS